MKTAKGFTITIILNTFFLCIIAYFLEYQYLYIQSVAVFGTTIFSKIFTFFAIFVAMFLLKTNWSDIGFTKKPKKIIAGFTLSVPIVIISLVLAWLIVYSFTAVQGVEINVSYEVPFSALEPATAYSPTAISYSISFVSAFITALITETLFRGFVLQNSNKYLKFYAANTLNVVCSIIWHMLIYTFNLTVGAIDMTLYFRSFAFTSIIYVSAAIRRSLYYRAKGNLWPCFFDCFFCTIVISSLKTEIIFPPNLVPKNIFQYFLSFLSSSTGNSNYSTIAVVCLFSIISLLITVIYCHFLKRRARLHYIKKMSDSTTRRNERLKNKIENEENNSDNVDGAPEGNVSKAE